MSKLVDQVSRAINEEFARQKFHASAGAGIWGTAIPPIDTKAIARAVLIAMRTPTEEMKEAAVKKAGSPFPEASEGYWEAMIDEALK